MNKWQCALIMTCGVVTAVLNGCTGHGLARGDAIRNDAIIGTWQGQNGHVYEVERGAGASYTAHVTQTGGTEDTLHVDLIDVDRQIFCQIPIGDGADGAPLYHFGLIAIANDTIQHRPLDERWLNEHTGSDNGLVVCEDPATMRDLLRAAIRDRAFGPTDTLQRVQD